MKTFVTSHCVTPVTRDCASQMLISAFLFRRVALNSTLMVGLKVLLGSLLRINFLCYFLENGLIRKKLLTYQISGRFLAHEDHEYENSSKQV